MNYIGFDLADAGASDTECLEECVGEAIAKFSIAVGNQKEQAICKC